MVATRYEPRAMSFASAHPPMMPSMRWISLTAATVAVGFGGCGCAQAPASSTTSSADDSALVSASTLGGDTADTKSEPAGTYALAVDYLNQTGGDLDGFFALRTALANSFADVCGDTFCSSDYNDIQPLDLSCSVKVADGTIKQCAYIFGASYQTVNDKTGTVANHAKSLTCKFDVDGTVADLLATLNAKSVTDPLRTPLPKSTTTIYDALVGCLP